MACSRPTFYDHICQKYGDVFLALDHDIQKDLQRFVAWARTHPVAISLLNQKRLPERFGERYSRAVFSVPPCAHSIKGLPSCAENTSALVLRPPHQSLHALKKGTQD